jgi:hypothetical protein
MPRGQVLKASSSLIYPQKRSNRVPTAFQSVYNHGKLDSTRDLPSFRLFLFEVGEWR